MKKIKKISKLIVTILVVVMAFSGCGTKEKDGKDHSLQDIKDKKTFVLGLDASFPPMGFKDENDTIVGYDIDLATEVCKRMGVTLKLQPIDWESKEMELNDAKSIDCIWNGLSYSKKRDKAMTLSDRYMTNKQVVVVLADSSFTAFSDLAGKTVALQSTSTAEDAVENNKEFKDSLKDIIKIDDNVKAMMDLEVGGSDAVVMDEVVAAYYMKQNEGKFRVLEGSLSDEEYVIGFRKGDTALCNEVMKCLEQMKEDGTLADITTKWFGSDISTVK